MTQAPDWIWDAADRILAAGFIDMREMTTTRQTWIVSALEKELKQAYIDGSNNAARPELVSKEKSE